MEGNSSWLEVPWTRRGFLHPSRAGDSLLSLYIVLGQPDFYHFGSTAAVQYYVWILVKLL